MAGGEEGHQLFDQLVVAEAAGVEGHAEEVHAGGFAFGELLLLLGDHAVADLSDG